MEHLELAEQLARRLAGGRQLAGDVEDLAQVARLGLVHAAARYDPARGVPFPSYAAAVISGRLKHHLRDRTWAVRPPRRMQELWLHSVGARERLTTRLNRSATIGELAGELDVSKEQLLDALAAQQTRTAESLDVLAEAEDSPWEPAAIEDGYARVEDRSWLGPALAALPERLQLILRLRFEQEVTQRQIAERIGVSQMHVSRLLAQALTRLRAAAG